MVVIVQFDVPPMTKNFRNAVMKLPLTYTNETKADYGYFLRSVPLVMIAAVILIPNLLYD